MSLESAAARRKSPFNSRVKTPAWSKDFISLIDGIGDFKVFLGNSIKPAGAVQGAVNIDQLRQQAQATVAAFDTDELAIARQYHNNNQILGYWKYLRKEVERLSQAGILDADFPLFQLKAGPTGQLKYVKVTTGNIQKTTIDCNEHEMVNPPQGSVGTPILLKESTGGMKLRQKSLNELFLKLTLVSKVQRPGLATLYNVFLAKQRALGSPYWDSYKIYLFLDHFLYILEDGSTRRSPFELIFGNSNLYELKLFLQHCLDTGTRTRLNDVNNFLHRQRDFYLKLALDITLEENEVHNNRKDLLAYDEERGIVKAFGITDELLEHYHETVVKRHGVVKQNGCPFATSKGVEKNALIESFEFFDGLMLNLMKQTFDFNKVFGR